MFASPWKIVGRRPWFLKMEDIYKSIVYSELKKKQLKKYREKPFLNIVFKHFV